MDNSPTIRRRVKPSEEGYLLLSVMFIMALLVLWLAVAVPKMTKSIQRDRDQETKERGKQYIRAIQVYYRKFGAYPPSEDALVKTNEIRFLRKKYVDPTTGKSDWKPILFGQNKVPTAMGFFGQPLSTGSTMAGIGPSGGNPMAGSSPMGGGGLNQGPGNGFGSPANGVLGSPQSGVGGGLSGAGVGTTSNGGATGSTDNSSGSNSNGSSSSGTGLTGQTFGGGGIIGFSPASPKQSLLIYKTKDHYNEWEFTYDPVMDMKMMSGGNAGAIGQPIGGGVPGAVGIPGITTQGSSPGPTNSGNSGNNGQNQTPAMPPDTSAPQ
jgi:type II secretory pathway pseudopilin PulG